MRPWQFGKPKNPGFGISKGYYLTILASKATLPSLLEIANPAGTGGAAVGLAAPLSPGADQEALSTPIERGAYVIATKDRKTVIKMLVVSKEEAGFDPEEFARSPLAAVASAELIARIRGTWNLLQLTIESHDPMVYASLDFYLGLAVRLAILSEGVVGDAICMRYLLPQDVIHRDRLEPQIDARDHVSVHFRTSAGAIHCFTLGMQKFNLPEIEVTGLLEADQGEAEAFMITLCEAILLGRPLREGDRVGADGDPFEVRVGGFDKALWEGISVFELLPSTRSTATEALAAWAGEAKRKPR